MLGFLRPVPRYRRLEHPFWAERLKVEVATSESDPAIPTDWKEAWNWAFQLAYLEKIGATSDLGKLHAQRLLVEKELSDGFAKVVKERTFFNLAASMKGT